MHLGFGVVGLAAGRRTQPALAYLVVGGVAYPVLRAYGLAVDGASAADVVPLNAADDWLHLVLGVGMIGLGVVARAAMRGTSARGGTAPDAARGGPGAHGGMRPPTAGNAAVPSRRRSS